MTNLLPAPTADYVAARQREFAGNADYFGSDSTIRLVVDQWPLNQVKDQVLAKVLVIDALYSTNIYYPDAVARHIVGQKIDLALSAGDPAVVERIATVDTGKRPIRYYSFATKYCSFHNPSAYHIFDDWIHWLLWQYQKAFAFSEFKKGDIRESYNAFARVMKDFSRHFKLDGVPPKALDKFLWIEAQQVWPMLEPAKPSLDGK